MDKSLGERKTEDLESLSQIERLAMVMTGSCPSTAGFEENVNCVYLR